MIFFKKKNVIFIFFYFLINKNLLQKYNWGAPKNKFSINYLIYNVKNFLIFLNQYKNDLKSCFKTGNTIKKNIFKKYNKKKSIVFFYFTPEELKKEKAFKKYYGESSVDNSFHIYLKSINEIDIYYYSKEKYQYISSIKFITIKNLFSLERFHLIIFHLIPFFRDFSNFLLLSSLINIFFENVKVSSIFFPMEGQLWEKSLIYSAKQYGINTNGFLHALNITTPTNNQIIFSELFSPKLGIAQCKEAKNILIKKGWEKINTSIRTINRVNILNINQKYYKNKKVKVLLLGSFMRVEDIAALKYCLDYYSNTNSYSIFYKPHPLIAKKVKSHLKKSIGNSSLIQIIKDTENLFFDILLSPLSSTSSIQLNPDKNFKVLIYYNPNFHCPNPLAQFSIKLKKVIENKNYVIKEKLISDSINLPFQKHQNLFN